MRSYAIRRLLLAIPTVFIITVTVFYGFRFIPGDVIEQMVDEMAMESGLGSELTVEYLRHALGLDVPVHVQYCRWMGFMPNADGVFYGIFQGNLGCSLWTGREIMPEIIKRFPISLELNFLTHIITFSVGIPIGIYSGLRQDGVIDYFGRGFAILMMALPNFWLATMIIVYPSILWNWTPPVQYFPIWEDPGSNLIQFILPAFLTGISGTGGMCRRLRTIVLEIMRQDYIRTAWSKGLTERMVLIKHAARNAGILLGGRIPQLILMFMGGSVIMEQIFCLPGIGRFMLDALRARDYPVMQVTNMIAALQHQIIILVTDLSYAWWDPRIVYK